MHREAAFTGRRLAVTRPETVSHLPDGQLTRTRNPPRTNPETGSQRSDTTGRHPEPSSHLSRSRRAPTRSPTRIDPGTAHRVPEVGFRGQF